MKLDPLAGLLVLDVGVLVAQHSPVGFARDPACPNTLVTPANWTVMVLVSPPSALIIVLLSPCMWRLCLAVLPFFVALDCHTVVDRVKYAPVWHRRVVAWLLLWIYFRPPR